MTEKRRITQDEIEMSCAKHNECIEEGKGEPAVFEGCIFEGLSMKEMQFNSAEFRSCEFIGCDLTGIGLCFSTLANVTFTECKCRGLTAEEATLENVSFNRCNLVNAMFGHDSVKNISFVGCDQNNMVVNKCYEPSKRIVHIETEQIRRMGEKEGLILQGCGGDPKEWLDGINDMLTENGILRNGSKFESCMVFEHKGCTSVLFPFEGVELNMGRLAMWRLQTHEQFGGTWLSDYVPNKLGGFISEEQSQERRKPDCPLIGQDSNIFSLMGIASHTLKQNGMAVEAREMCYKIMGCGSYAEALTILDDYVTIVSIDEYAEEDEDCGEDCDECEDEDIGMKGGME